MARAADTFTRVDNASAIGTASGGFTYTVTTGTFGISSNQFINKGTVSRVRAGLDLGSTDHFSQVSYKSFSAAAANQCVVCVRFDAAADTCYYGTIREDGVSTRIIKVVAGATTTLVTTTTTGVATGDVVRLEAIGTTLTLYKNGVVMATITDSSLTTGTRAGFESVGSIASTCGGDNFAAGPITLGSATEALTVTAAAAGRAIVSGSATEALTIGATATGRAVVRGSATEALTIAAAATGRAVVRGSATEALTVSATATGRAVVRGSATEALMVNATATGRAIVRGSGAAVVMITGSASGGANTQGSAAATLTVSASAVGRAVVVGAGTAAVGVVATAAAPVITNSAPNIIVRRMLTSTQAGTITISQETHVTAVVRQTVDLDVQIHRSDETVVIV